MTIWGVDISGWQAGIDLARVKVEGFEAVIAKATEGASYTSPEYAAQKDGARRNGLRFMAYHYVIASAPAAEQATRFELVEPDRSVPVMLDHENGSGDLDVLRAVHAEFVRRGYRVALLYLPRWYWQNIGRPDLTGLPPLMASSYGTDQPGYASALYPGNDAAGWAAYGGNEVAILQFTQRARVSGREIDAWAFRGSAAQLDALFTGAEGGTTVANEAKDVQTQLRGPELAGWPQLGDRTLVDAVGDVRDQLGGPDHHWGGWPQLGGRTLVDAVAAIGEKLGVPGCRDPKGQ